MKDKRVTCQIPGRSGQSVSMTNTVVLGSVELPESRWQLMRARKQLSLGIAMLFYNDKKPSLVQIDRCKKRRTSIFLLGLLNDLLLWEFLHTVLIMNLE